MGNFLSALLVRLCLGAAFGLVGGLVLGHKAVLNEFSHDRLRSVAGFFALCGLLGAVFAVLSTPDYRRPWFRYKRLREKAPRKKDGKAPGLPGK